MDTKRQALPTLLEVVDVALMLSGKDWADYFLR